MTQYIDKSALVAEIERIKKEECPIDTYEGRIKLFYFERFFSFIDKLEVKEVDLEKEVRNFLNDNPTSQNVQDLIKKYVSDHADCRWLDASELEQLLNDFVLEYDIIKNREYEQQCKVSNDGNNR